MMKKMLFFLALFLSSLTHFQKTFARYTIFFSPYDKPTTHLIELFKQAKKSIYAAVYMITDKEIAQALIKAHERGVDVQIITDVISTGKYGKADFLAENGIRLYILDDVLRSVLNSRASQTEKNVLQNNKRNISLKATSNDRWYSNDPLMHHKFAIIDEVNLWTGSFNWTGAANKKNHENVITTTDREICKVYSQHFIKMINNGSCKPYFPGRISTYMPTSLAGKIMAVVSQVKKEDELREELLDILNKHELCTLRT